MFKSSVDSLSHYYFVRYAIRKTVIITDSEIVSQNFHLWCEFIFTLNPVQSLACLAITP